MIISTFLNLLGPEAKKGRESVFQFLDHLLCSEISFTGIPATKSLVGQFPHLSLHTLSSNQDTSTFC